MALLTLSDFLMLQEHDLLALLCSDQQAKVLQDGVVGKQ